MKFISNLNEEEYKEYFSKQTNFSFLQSYEWGQFCIKGKKQKPYYVGLKDDNNKLICASLLLKTPLPFGLSYFYAPRGFIIDYSNKELLKLFTKEIKLFIKKEKAIYLKIDPEVSYQSVDNDAKVTNEMNNYDLHNYLLSLGYIHQGFNKLYEKNQPRYTFIIDLKDKYIEKMSKSFIKNVEKANKYELEFIVGNETNLDEFKRVYQMTKERANFAGYDLKYYEEFYKIFHEHKMAELFLVKLYPYKILKVLNNELDDLNTQLKDMKNDHKIEKIKQSIERIKNDIIFYESYKDLKDGIIVSTHIMCFVNKTATALYAGSDKRFQSTYANNFMYYEKIKYAYEHGYTKLDLFGTVGDPNTKYKNLAGIFEFKKQLGGQLYEFIGEYDLVNNKLLYYFLKISLPIYRKLKKHLK